VVSPVGIEPTTY